MRVSTGTKANRRQMVKIVESIYGTFYYHLSETGLTGKPSLCGNKNVMQCNAKIETWNKHFSHLREVYCVQCDEIKSQQEEGKGITIIKDIELPETPTWADRK
jgi:hypothetical protein